MRNCLVGWHKFDEWRLINHESLPDEPMDSPTLHDRYQLTQLLGRKAGRRTWLAIDQQTQQQVVIKLLLFSADFEWDALKLFEREAQTLQDLDHPSIPKYLDWFELEWEGSSGFALVQTHIPALSLETIVRSGRTFSSEDLQQIAEQVLDILDYLHSRNPPVIHRDLKPSNILLGDRSGNSPGKVALVDFGAVQNLAASQGGTITIVGTYGYMPMEQFGDRAVPASDLYSLGATMLYLATGKDPADLMADDLAMAIEDIVGLNVELKQWIRQLMQMQLKDRPASVKVARQLLRQLQPLPELNRSMKSTLAERTALPPGLRFYLHAATDDYFVLSFTNARFRSHRLTPPDIARIVTWTIVLVFFGIPTCVVLLLQFTWAVLYVLLSIMVSMIADHYRRQRRYRALRIHQGRLELSASTRLASNLMSGLYGERLNGVFNARISAWSKQPCLDRAYPLHQVWEIEYYQADMRSWDDTHCISDSFLKLKVGDRIWHFTGTQREIGWLVGELSHYLQIPATRYIPPESSGVYC
jgi:serine/threonine protein kinase